MFKGPQGFGRMMNILMCAIMCAVLSIAIPLIIEGATGAQGLLNPSMKVAAKATGFDPAAAAAAA